jgi:hypothetical protein
MNLVKTLAELMDLGPPAKSATTPRFTYTMLPDVPTERFHPTKDPSLIIKELHKSYLTRWPELKKWIYENEDHPKAV